MRLSMSPFSNQSLKVFKLFSFSYYFFLFLSPPLLLSFFCFRFPSLSFLLVSIAISLVYPLLFSHPFMIVFFMTYLIPILQIPLSPQILNLFLVSSHFILPTHHFSFFFLPFATLIDMCCVCGGFDERCFIFFISFFFPEAI